MFRKDLTPRILATLDYARQRGGSGVEGLRKLGADVGDVRVVSVDLDGNDGSIVRTLLAAGFAPDVFIVEYNAKIPPNVEFEMPYNGITCGMARTIFMASRCFRGCKCFSLLSIRLSHAMRVG